MKTFHFRAMFAAIAISLALAGACGVSDLVAQANPSSPSESIVINAQSPAHPFPHYWEKMFGSGHAILALRRSYSHDLIK